MTLGDVALQIGFGYLTNFRPVFTISPTLPTLKEMMRHFIYGNLAREILAYYVHRCLHHRWFYARHHKLHHSFTTPIAFTGLYTTPVEHFFADIIPIVLPLALIAYYYEPVHILSFNIFLISVLLVGTAEHSKSLFGINLSHSRLLFRIVKNFAGADYPLFHLFHSSNMAC